MYYSPVTNTVLITDKSKGKVYERTTAGVFVRQFTVPPGNTTVLLGVTRGPSGDVFATDAAFGRVYRWSATNTYIGHTELTGVYAPSNIVWAGNRKATAASVTGSEEGRYVWIAPQRKNVVLPNRLPRRTEFLFHNEGYWERYASRPDPHFAQAAI